MNILNYIQKQLFKTVSAVSLAFYRIVFGLMMFGGVMRFILMGWVEELYLKPTFFFKYYGFEWVKVLPETALYSVFVIMAVSALFVAFGLFYRFAIIAFFLSFTYIELLDVTNYLNHYYFVSLISFLMIFLPLSRYFSLDNIRKPHRKITEVPQWMLVALKAQIGIVYFFGGIAKIKYDWLFLGQPLKIWLSASTDLPIIGFMLDFAWVAFVIAWLAMIFDLTTPFLLATKRTRIYIYVVIVVFHILTARLFYIGMFPYIMMVNALLFFPASLHRKWLEVLQNLIKKIFRTDFRHNSVTQKPELCRRLKPVLHFVIMPLFIFQLIMPFRYLAYPNNLLWTEQGFRYSWNIMLIEKNAYTEFWLTDTSTGNKWMVLPSEYLTKQQARQMSTQPDLMLQFAHYVAEKEKIKYNLKAIEVRVESYASLNGRSSRPYTNPTVDLTKERESFRSKKWILPLEQDNSHTLTLGNH